ncbi:adenylosuccinate synthase [Convivina praedatoris]|uniref:Adenylosuccinate synthetase n=1 Tax=Convivina praedatoris TaxID=2880963 RepID=A0ABM9D2Q6_9LACO|nr:adenylosuccinate synthase [Convivina sp. LMG 32447]CAH1851807.1 Adenylosuccinate synthetase [Convivina sp. LMG 32447]CAH1853892.1 Adenylosuccinate synthetase [Convivina sp. LMG 32447]CAH1854185.1 Adenylosuccinate synthetase [Convivina sp. LMG 32447]
MSSIVIVGSQWGDEGKGKITDFLSRQADFVVRYSGGDNAGHTLVIDGKKLHVQLIPSGIFLPQVTNVIGNGVVINPATLFAELDYLAQNGVDTKNLRISSRAQIIMPYHIQFDALQEKLKDNQIGTTHKGIGPAYMDKLERIGIRVADLLDPESLKEKLEQALKIKNLQLTKLFDEEPLEFQPIYDQYLDFGRRMKPFVTDTSYLINKALDQNKKVLFEGAQGVMLDVDHGTYPYVTSSNPIAGGAVTGIGIGPNRINQVIGVCKAYTSRVGDGPFPTELFDEIGSHIREVAHEYGVVTKRPRRIGWLDAVVLRHAKRVSGLTYLSLNCLDVLSGLKTIKIATQYELDGQLIDYYPASNRELARCKPIYEELPGWDEDITDCQTIDDLPVNARHYLERVSELVGLPLDTFAVGPDREQTHVLKNVWDVTE